MISLLANMGSSFLAAIGNSIPGAMGSLSAIVGPAAAVPAQDGSSIGKWVFVGALALLLLWLVLMPRRLIGQENEVPPWWRNVRVWAIVVAAIQICIYAYFG